MITTVTVSTISTTATSIAITGLAGVLGLVAVICLLGFLCVRELAGASENGSPKLLVRSLDVVITPLVIAFVVTLAIKVAEVLR